MELDNIVHLILNSYGEIGNITPDEICTYLPSTFDDEEYDYIVEELVRRGLRIINYQPSVVNNLEKNIQLDYTLLTEEETYETGRIMMEGKACIGIHSDITEEEKELRRKEAAGEKAREKLITHNMRLVVFFAKKYINTRIPFEDLVQIGNLALIRAADNYDYRKGAFSTFAGSYIKNDIHQAFERDNILGGSKMALRLARQINAFKDDYLKKNGTVPSDQIIMNELNISPRRYFSAQLAEVSNNVLSTDQPINSNDSSNPDTVTLLDFYENSYSPILELLQPPKTEDDIINEMERSAEIENYLYSILDQTSAEILLYRYGIGFTGEAHTFLEAQEHFGIPRARISVIEKKAFKIIENDEGKEQLYKYLYA